MKQKVFYLILVLTALLPFETHGQETASIDSVTFDINTIEATSLHMKLYIAESFDRLASLPHYIETHYPCVISLNQGGQTIYEMSFVGQDLVALGSNFVNVQLELDSEMDLEKLFTNALSADIRFTSDLLLFDSDTTNHLLLKSTDINKAVRAATYKPQGALVEEMKNALGGIEFVAANEGFEISREVEGGDTATVDEYVINFSLLRQIRTLGSSVDLRYKIDVRISTEETNPLNKVDGFLVWRPKNKLAFELEAGVVGNQRFDTGMVRINASYQGLGPNLIDLRSNYERLALKPWYRLGVTLFQSSFEDSELYEEDNGLNVFLEVNYYIPVLEKYAISFNGEARWSPKFRTGNEFRSLYSLSVVYETPLEDAKILFKVESGENDLHLGQQSRILIGLLLDRVSI